MKTDVTVIGPGNWGSSLIAALQRAGIPVREIVAKTRKNGAKTLQNAQLNGRILWLCVPDGAIAEVATKIVERRGNLTDQIVVHSSGALTVAALDAARKAGAAVASVHPVMSFPTRRIVPSHDVMFGVEAPEKVIKRTLYGLIRKIGGRPFAIQSGRKALYHAAGTLASPLLVSELSAAMATARLAGLSAVEARNLIGALAQATVRNVFEHGEAQSFSGPFARGDTATIRLHLRTLAKHPMVTDVYRSLARHAIETLSVERKNELRLLFSRRMMSDWA
ncbi:Rossmann-like and DUF2520 domain-containing protein [Alloacidobacterium sp.]|uniref:Rossmann-like and DUF2520 domain-containing protein n=1 Tax=Alloacidobacterium sp. TaxID=2951999 RepID=UPI002D5A935F|nr:DUF2520 domain-containing protein [Alloacidobacterium sp.]HYK35767.1 DUF2520 domain-containing protein [Alloacidobacterium sp.]